MSSHIIIDSDLLIWHLRGRHNIMEHLLNCAKRGVLSVSAISRAEVLCQMHQGEEGATLRLLDGLTTVPVDAAIVDRAASIVRELSWRGVTLHLPDVLIGATAIELGAELHTCNASHYRSYDIPIVEIRPKK